MSQEEMIFLRPQTMYSFRPPGHRWWRTKKGKMIALLWDMAWHSTPECIRASGHRFGGTIGSLRDDGWRIETRNVKSGSEHYEYRLASLVCGEPLNQRKRLYLSHEATRALARGELTQEAIEVAREVLKENEGEKQND